MNIVIVFHSVFGVDDHIHIRLLLWTIFRGERNITSTLIDSTLMTLYSIYSLTRHNTNEQNMH